ncbi:Uncharacterised protein [Mycobacterium tuberculosis]|nr:Uncharacterised protein [Mycobacterium tuberculosis]
MTSTGGNAAIPPMNCGSQCQYQRSPRRRRLATKPSGSEGRGRCGL